MPRRISRAGQNHRPGGLYQWSGPSSNIVLRGSSATDAIMQKVDASLDDGDLTTGDFTKLAGVGFGYRVH